MALKSTTGRLMSLKTSFTNSKSTMAPLSSTNNLLNNPTLINPSPLMRTPVSWTMPTLRVRK